MKNGYTFAREHTAVYTWKINNIRSRLFHKSDSFLLSSVFSTGSEIKDKWCVNLFFNNQNTVTRSRKYFSIFINNLNDREVKARVKFYIFNGKQEKILIFRSSLKEFKDNSPSLGVKKFLAKSNLFNNSFELIPYDSLTICTEVSVSDNEITVPITNLFDCSKNNMKSDYKELYNSRAYSDITITVENQEIQAHRIILMARSPVLAAMFNHDLIEKKTNRVSITDISPEIFEKVLRYIYTDEVSDLDSDAADLLEAADRYQLLSLKKMCEESLCRSLNRENALKVLVLADRHGAKDLKEYATRCISVDASNIINTEDFKEYEKSNPSLGLQLFRVLAANCQGAKVTYLSSEN